MTRRGQWKWAVCGVLLLATLLNYMDRQALPQTATDLKSLYALGDARYGLLERYFSLAFAAGSIGFGWLADRFGPRRLYPLVLLGWSVAGLLTPFAGWPSITGWLESPGDDAGTGAFHWLLFCRTMLGLFEAGHWPCALITVRHILTTAERPLGNGLLQSGASLGAILIPLYVREVRHLGGDWGVVFWTVGAAGLLWIPLWLWLVRPGDLDGPAPRQAEKSTGLTGWPLVRCVVVLAVTVSCLTVSWQFLRAWLPKFLRESHGYDADRADLAVAGYYVAAEVGCLLVGVIVKILIRMGCAVHAARVLTFAMYTALTALAAFVPQAGSGTLMLALLMTAGAGILGLHPLYYSLAQELPQRRLGIGSGLFAAGGWVVAAFFQGSIGAHIEATKSYDIGLVIAGLAPALALLTILALWKNVEPKPSE